MKTKTVIKVFWLFIFMGTTAVNAQIAASVNVNIAPPPLPVYVQPPCPVDGYVWIPGYWAYGDNGYYWVPGQWIYPAEVDFLWTPGYWGFYGGYYRWYAGYWGPHVGFYGGVHYGYGYNGVGFYGGRWENGRFRYNTAISNVNTAVIHNTYIDRTLINNTKVNTSSFNGQGGINARPTAVERTAINENHIQPTAAQQSNEQVAGRDKNQLASVNKGHPSAVTKSTVVNQLHNNQAHTENTTPANHQPAHAGNTAHPSTHTGAVQQHNYTRQGSGHPHFNGSGHGGGRRR